MRAFVLTVLVAGGCAGAGGRVGLLGVDPGMIGVKLLRPEVEGRSCRANVLGIPLGAGSPSIEEALGQVLALDPEGNVVTHAEIRWRRLVTGVYNRGCIEVRGDLCRGTSAIIIPMPPHEHHGP